MSQELFKIMLAGDTSTGKTSFITQLIYQVPDRNPKTTENLTFFALRLTNPDAILQIWDSPGDPRFKFQVISALSAFNAVLIFVDVTNEFTLHRARAFIEQLRVYPKLQIYLIQSKVELTVKNPHKRKITKEEVNQLAAQQGGLAFEYKRDYAIEPILQQIIKNRGERIFKKSVSVPASVPSITGQPTEEVNNTACQCTLY